MDKRRMKAFICDRCNKVVKMEVDKMSEYEWGFLVLPVKAYKLGYEQAIAEIEKQRQEILDKIDELEFTNIVRMNSNLGANTTQDRIKEYIKQQLNQQKTEE